MNRHVPISTLFLCLAALGSSCKGTEGSVFLDKNLSEDAGGGSDGPPDSGEVVYPDVGPLDDPDANRVDSSFDVDASFDGDGAVDPDGSIDTDGSIEGDGSVLGDGGGVDTGVPNVDCTQNPPVFPSFDRSCSVAADCDLGWVQINCCGTQIVTGINESEKQRFDEAAALCNSQYPGCGCATMPTTADDGTTETNSGPAIVQCVANTCQSTFPPDPTSCGNLTCDPATDVCVQRGPVGPGYTWTCEPIPSGCEQDRTCSCAGAALCNTPFTACTEQGPNMLGCECLQCQ